MYSFSHSLWRLLAAACGWLVAVFASIVFVAVAGAMAVVPAAQAFVDSPDAPITAGFGVLVTRMLGALALGSTLIDIVWPGWLLAACLAEIAGARSLLVHLGGAAAIALAGLLASTPRPDATSVQLILAAGLVAGFVHWLVAGRSAGLALPAPGPRGGEGDPRPPHA